MNYKELKSEHFKTLPQYHFDRDLMVKSFKEHAPLFIDFMWDKGCNFDTDSFHFYRTENEEFYLVHNDSGTIINWYKHLGRTNTCNKSLSIEDLNELLKLLNDDILYITDYKSWYKIHIDEME